MERVALLHVDGGQTSCTGTDDRLTVFLQLALDFQC